MRGLTRKERSAEIKSRQLKYTWFGSVALVLQLVPLLSMFFLLTSAAGSALWVVKLEEQKRLTEDAQTAGAGEVPSYSDDPM